MRSRANIPKTLHAARTAARISLQRRFVTRAGWWFAGAMGVACIVTGTLRLASGPDRWWMIPAGLGVIAIAAAWIAAWLGRWSLPHAAGEVDRNNGTEGALRTGIEIADTDGDPSLVALARARAEAVASSVEPARGIPEVQPAGWWAAIPAAGLCLLAGFFLDPIARHEAAPDAGPIVQRALVETELAKQDLAQVAEASLPDPESWADTRAEIEALEEALRREGGEDAALRAAAALERAADELEAQTERSALDERASLDRADLFDAPDDEPTGLVDRLADALARNDMLEAEATARELDRVSEALSETERRRLADTLEDLADRLGPDPTEPRPSDTEPGTVDPVANEPAPGEPATSEPPAEGAPASDPAEQSEQEQGDTPEAEAETAPPAEPGDDAAEDPSNSSPSEPLQDALRERAEQLREPEEPRSGDPSQPRPNEDPPGQDQSNQGPTETQEPAENQPAKDREPGEPSGQEPGNEGSEQRQQPGQQEQPQQEPGQQERTQRETGPSETGEPSTPPQGSRESSPQTDPQAEPDPNRPRSGEAEPTPSEPGSPEQAQPEQRQPEQGEPNPGQPEQGQTREEPANGANDPSQPSEQPGQQPDQSQGSEQRSEPGDRPGSVERAVRELRERQAAREQNRRVADALRQRARELMGEPGSGGGTDPAGRPGGAAGEQDPLAERSGDRLPRDPSRFEPVDASSRTPEAGKDERVVGEWFDPDRTDLPAGSSPEARERLGNAARRARDAVDNQQVPRRYRDFIRRVFDRVEQQGEPAPSTPAPQGQDADR